MHELIHTAKTAKPCGFVLFNNACNWLILKYSLEVINVDVPQVGCNTLEVTNSMAVDTHYITLICNDGFRIPNVPLQTVIQSKTFKDFLSQSDTRDNPIELIVPDVDNAPLRVLVRFMQLTANIINPNQEHDHDIIDELERSILGSIAPCKYFDPSALRTLLELSEQLQIPALYCALKQIAQNNPTT
jgi:hypothetical protein